MDTAPAAPVDPYAALKAAGAAMLAGSAPAVSAPPVPTPVAQETPPAAGAIPGGAEPAPGPEAGVAAPVAAEPVAISNTVLDLPVFAGTRARSCAITLEWPLLWQGQLFEAVVVTRPTTGQVAAYFDRLLASEASASLRFPVFFTPDGQSVPDAVMDALDPDDSDRIMEAVSDFLPDRLRRLQAPPPASSSPPAGDPIGPTS